MKKTKNKEYRFMAIKKDDYEIFKSIAKEMQYPYYVLFRKMVRVIKNRIDSKKKNQ